MSFFLLFATGAGLVYYYDREKKRHIQGTHLMVSLLFFSNVTTLSCRLPLRDKHCILGF